MANYTHDYIRREIPEEISEAGGAYIQLVDTRMVPLKQSITEAINGNYVIGNPELLRANFIGLLKSMAAGVQRDGHARQLADFFTIYAQPTGELDPEKGWDPLVNSMKVRIRLLNEMSIDTSGWEFRDVTVGKRDFDLSMITTGVASGVVKTCETVHIDGYELPSHDDLRISWECGDKSGDVAAAAFSSNVSRIDIEAGALSELWSAAYDGKPIVVTVRGCYTTKRIEGVIKYAAPVPSVTKVVQGTRADDHVGFSTASTTVYGCFPGGKQTDDQLLLESIAGGSVQAFCDLTAAITASGTTSLTLGNGIENSSELPESDWNGHDARFVFKRGGTRYEHIVAFSAP